MQSARTVDLAVLAHPYWLGHVTTDLTHLEGATGLEVFNYGTEVSINKGNSTYLWDGLLDRKRPLFGLAVDDTHWKLPDAGGGWIMAKAAACTPDAILNAVAKGRLLRLPRAGNIRLSCRRRGSFGQDLACAHSRLHVRTLARAGNSLGTGRSDHFRPLFSKE